MVKTHGFSHGKIPWFSHGISAELPRISGASPSAPGGATPWSGCATGCRRPMPGVFRPKMSGMTMEKPWEKPWRNWGFWELLRIYRIHRMFQRMRWLGIATQKPWEIPMEMMQRLLFRFIWLESHQRFIESGWWFGTSILFPHILGF